MVEVKWVTVFFDVPADRQAGAEAVWRQRAGATMSERRGPNGEFATFMPADGDAYLRVQRVRGGMGGVHIDLHTEDTEALLAAALRLGATVTRPDAPRLGLRSPGGAPFCVVGWHGEQTPPSRRPVRQVTLRVPEDVAGSEVRFWEDLTGQATGPVGIRVLEAPGAGQACWRVGAEPPTTDRLVLREMTDADLPGLRAIMADGQTMTAYEGAYTEAEILDWLDWQRASYREHGFGLWAVVLRKTGEMVGQCGITWQDICGERVLEVGYLFNRAHWRRGYATEAARACRDWAFAELAADRVFAQVRDTNTASMNVATRLGMTVRNRFVKRFRGVRMPHLAFAVDRATRFEPRETAHMKEER